MKSNSAARATACVGNVVRSRSSHSSVAKKLSAIAVDAPICQDCRGGTLGGIEVCGAQPVIIDEGVVDLSSDESLQATDTVSLFPVFRRVRRSQ